MKLIGRDIQFQIQIPGTSMTAGAYFNDVNFDEDAEVINVSTALSSPGQQRVDDASSTARISCSGFVDAWTSSQAKPTYTNYFGSSGSSSNFIDLAVMGAVVNLRLTKLGYVKTEGDALVGQGKLLTYAPWQISKVSLKHGKRAASEDNMELIGTGGAVPADYTPGMTIDE